RPPRDHGPAESRLVARLGGSHRCPGGRGPGAPRGRRPGQPSPRRSGARLPGVEMVGLPEAAVRESAARVRAALAAAGEKFPHDRRITVHLAPAELRKSGAALDLPIAVAL